MTRAAQRRWFTLTELSVAMIILMLIIYGLFRIIVGAQIAWEGSRAMTEMHERASLAMDVISRDLRAMKVSDLENAGISFSRNGSDIGSINGSAFRFACVTSSGLGVGDDDATLLSEVGYSVSATDSEIHRWRTTESAGDAKWNFYENDAATWGGSGSWEDSVVLVTGVESLSFTAYSDSVTQVTAATDTAMPSFVTVSLTLIDEKVAAAGTVQTDRSKLTFTKTIHLNRGD